MYSISKYLFILFYKVKISKQYFYKKNYLMIMMIGGRRQDFGSRGEHRTKFPVASPKFRLGNYIQ